MLQFYSMKWPSKHWAEWGVIAVIVAVIGLRIGLVIAQPAPLYIDEVASGAHARHILTEGSDFHNAVLPVMSASFGGGYTTAVYLYPLTLWSALFGVNDQALRAFSQFVTCLAVLVMAISMYLWRGKRAGYIAATIGLVLPWSWINGNLAWDPAITPLFIALAFAAFSVLASKNLQGWRLHAVYAWMTLAAVLAAYSYPPCRVSAPILLFGALLYLWRTTKPPFGVYSTSVVTGTLACLPLVHFLLQPDALGRSAQLSVFHDSLLAGIGALIGNLLLLLNPYTLFITGDANLRHSTGFQGMLGWVGAIGLIALAVVLIRHRAVRQSIAPVVIIACFGIAANLLASALTNESQPHYLRAVGAWPFFVILITLGWEAISRLRRHAIYALMALGVVCVMLFIADLCTGYVERRTDAFSQHAATPAEQQMVDYYYDRLR